MTDFEFVDFDCILELVLKSYFSLQDLEPYFFFIIADISMKFERFVVDNNNMIMCNMNSFNDILQIVKYMNIIRVPK